MKENERTKEDQELKKQENHPAMSEFCESMMKASDDLADLRSKDDTALVIVSDGHFLAVRHGGSRYALMEALCNIMMNDTDFAEVIITAAMKYSSSMIGRPRPAMAVRLNTQEDSQSN